MIMDCPFCNEYINPTSSQFYQEIGKRIGCKNRVLLETENWYVIPTIGSLTVGYVLLVTKRHFPSLANINREMLSEMLNLKKIVETVLFKQLGLKCVAFEHGKTTPVCRSANSIDHVHIHILPVPSSVWLDISPDIPKTRFEKIDSYEKLYTLFEKKLPDSYVFFQDADQNIYYNPDASKMPSQIFRKCIASYLGCMQWDWHSESYSDNIQRTIDFFDKAR